MVTISTIINGAVKLSKNFKIERKSGNAVLIRDTEEKDARYNYLWIHENNVIENNNVRYNAYKENKWFFGAFQVV